VRAALWKKAWSSSVTVGRNHADDATLSALKRYLAVETADTAGRLRAPPQLRGEQRPAGRHGVAGPALPTKLSNTECGK